LDTNSNSRAEILEIISLVFWKKLSFHKDIIKLTDLLWFLKSLLGLSNINKKRLIEIS
jgi:hypothetical protein